VAELAEPAELGLFVFRHPTDWGAQIEYSDLYERESVPLRPLIITELPVLIRSIVEPLRFAGLDFRGVARLQPAEFVECDVWEGYMASDGTLRSRTPL